MPKLFGKEVSATTLGLLGAGLGGILGASGSKGQTSGTQGYAGGIPDYTATRNLAPNAFASTITDPITQEVRARRPGEAGRQYFTDALGQSRVNFTRGADNAILGGAELDALNATNLAQQKQFDAAGAELLGIASLNQQGQIAGGVGEGTGIAAGAEVVPTAGAGVVPAAGVPAAGAAAAGVPAAGAAGVGAGVPAAAGAAGAAGAGVPAAGAVDPNAAFNSFISPFFNQVDGLTPAQLIQLGASGFDLSTIASTLDVDATALSNAIAQATNNAATAAGAGVPAAGTGGVPAAGAGTEVVPADAVETLLNSIEQRMVASGDYTDNGDGTITDSTNGYVYDNDTGKGFFPTTNNAAGVVPATGADGNGVVSNSVLDGFGEVVNTTGTGQLTSAQLKQAVLDGTMDYNTAYGLLGKADAVNPFGFTEDEKLTLGISESQRTGQGYKQNPTTGAMDLYDYDTGAWVGSTDVANDTVVEAKGALDGSTDAAVADAAAFNNFIAPFSNQKQLTPAQLIQLGASGFDLSTIASTLDVDATELSGAIVQATNNAEVESVINMVDPSDGFSDTEAASVAKLILDGKTGITDVAGQFENVSDMDVIEGLIRGGYESPAAMTERLTPYNTDLTEVQLMASLLSQGRTTPEELAAYYGNNPDYPEYAGVTAAEVRGFAKDLGIKGYAAGGDINGYYLGGTTDGMADNVPATIDNQQPAALSDGEFVIPADVVSHLGNGNSDSGAQNLYSMMERVRTDRTGNPNQGNQIDPNQYLA
jgi:hypothetical protein